MARRKGSAAVRKELRGSSTEASARTKGFVALIILVLVVVAIGIVSYLKFFRFTAHTPADLVPADAELLMSINWRTDSEQSENLADVASRLGDFKLIDGVLRLVIGTRFANSRVIFPEDIAPWLSGDVVWARRTVNEEKLSLVFFPVADITSRDNFLRKIQSEADTTSSERYKGYDITTVTGTTTISYIIYGDYLIVAPRPQALQAVLEIVAGSGKSLSKAPDYEIIARKSQGDHVLFMMTDIKDLLQDITLPNVDLESLKGGGPARLGILVSAEQNGLRFSVALPGSKIQDTVQKNFSDTLAQRLPADLPAYLGSSSGDRFLRNYLEDVFSSPLLVSKGLSIENIQSKYGLNFEEDVYSLLKNEFAVVDFEGTGKSTFALVAKIDDQKTTQDRLQKLETAITDIINENSSNKASFQESIAYDTPVRYIALPGSTRRFLNYAVSKDLLILATDREGIDRILGQLPNAPTLAQSDPYQIAGKSLPVEGIGGTLFLDRSLVLSLLSGLGIDFSQYKDRIVGMRLVTESQNDGLVITGFLPVL